MARTKPSNQTAKERNNGIKKPRKSTQGKAPRKGHGGKKAISIKQSSIKKPHRFRPGTVALREIRRYQKDTDNLLKWLPFTRTVREAAQEVIDDIRFTKGALEALRDAAQAELVTEFEHAQDEAIHAKRVTIMPKDMRISRKIRLNSRGRPIGFTAAAPILPERVTRTVHSGRVEKPSKAKPQKPQKGHAAKAPRVVVDPSAEEPKASAKRKRDDDASEDQTPTKKHRAESPARPGSLRHPPVHDEDEQEKGNTDDQEEEVVVKAKGKAAEAADAMNMGLFD